MSLEEVLDLPLPIFLTCPDILDPAGLMQLMRGFGDMQKEDKKEGLTNATEAFDRFIGG